MQANTFLNQAHRHREMCPWFLEIVFVRKVCASVCVSPPSNLLLLMIKIMIGGTRQNMHWFLQTHIFT